MANSYSFTRRQLLRLFFLLLAVHSGDGIASGEEAAAAVDRVTDLPGQPPVKFRHYSGYVKLRPNQSKALFYWFFQAQHHASRKPLVLWLNGGPGCSSIAFGAAQELGPFLVAENGTRLVFNKHSWNKAANMLFLESPVGVGFSYTNDSNDVQKLGDRVTADDSHAFLINWFKRFPAFKSHDFYLAGESYAGHYVPQLAELIYERNKAAPRSAYINLKGFMIGNAVINDETDAMGMVDFAWNHGIISDQLHRNVKQCFADEYSRRKSRHRRQGSNNLEAEMMNCSNHLNGFAQAYTGIDIYSIYTPLCLTTTTTTTPKFANNHHNLNVRTFFKDLWRHYKLPSSGYDPCTETYAKAYFNRPDVQKALHANLTKLPYPYDTCSSMIVKWDDTQDTVLPIIRKLIKAGLRIWIYSGDTDGRVPVTSTRYSVNSMGLEVEEEWRAWFHKSQVAGWVETYRGGLVLATVRGAGHQVPVLAPQQSLSLFAHFLSATQLPSSPSGV
ncbi:unnamed protein product [Linum tenue]|uniref:Carboxypeptidase n=1 Tax=Linum tenue TaxID=586396 RepID=A0AAV0K2F6_9ROSI|nr:unnamed protein product [Linum tenue]